MLISSVFNKKLLSLHKKLRHLELALSVPECGVFFSTFLWIFEWKTPSWKSVLIL